MQFKAKKHLKIIATSISLLLAPAVNAININDVAGGVTTTQMMTTLSGAGVTISNLTVTNVPGCNSTQGVGVFTNGVMGGAGPVLSEPTGVVISSGAITGSNRLDSSNDNPNVYNMMCSGRVSDVDMRAIEGQVANGEYAAIEFDVVPSFSTMAIPFQFGSDEFPEYVCSAFNDIVGIFVSGPNISGPFSGGAENYAKTSGGDLSSINWVNTGAVGYYGNAANCGSLLNTAFYTDNSNGDIFGGNATVASTNTNLEMDGFTNTLFQPIAVVAGQTYHVKIAVADAGDLSWDSAAFIHPLFSTATFSGFDYGDAPNTYGTLTSNGGPSHGVDSSIYIGGAAPDSEVTGIPTSNADGDDLDGTDDEDGIAGFPLLSTAAVPYSVNVNVTNNSGNTAKLVGWIDFNRNGVFETNEGTQTLVSNGISGTATLNWPAIARVAGVTYARIRFSTDASLTTSTTGSGMSDGEVEDYILTIGDPVFNTSSKTVVDINGGIVDPGDILQYTITINETGGINLQNIQVTDVVDANLAGINFTTLPAGSTNNTVANNIDITGITIPAGGSVAIVYETTIAGGTSPGTNINNTATISHAPSGVSFDAIAPTVNVGVIPASGVKQLYIDNVVANTGEMTRTIVAAADRTRTTINRNESVTIVQSPVFQTPFTITGGNDVIVQLWLQDRNNNGSRTVRVDLFKSTDATPFGSINSGQFNNRIFMTLAIPVATDQNFSINDYLRIVVTNTSNNNGDNVRIESVRNSSGVDLNSQVQMQTNTVINTDSIFVYKEPYPSTLQFSSYEPGNTVYIRAVVSDPFGSADITGANLTITDANITTTVNDQAMSLVPTATTASSKTFEYIYNIPPTPDGFWTINVTADEGSEGTISHTKSSTMIVGTAAITVSKSSEVILDPISSSNYKAIPGAIVEYTVNVDNAGFGYADNNSIVVADPIPVGTTLFFGQNPPVPFVVKPVDFIDGATASGLSFTLNVIDLGNTADDVEFYNMGGTVLVTPTYDANGFDTTSPPIDAIRINPKGEFMGSDGTTNPSLQLKFRVRID